MRGISYVYHCVGVSWPMVRLCTPFCLSGGRDASTAAFKDNACQKVFNIN